MTKATKIINAGIDEEYKEIDMIFLRENGTLLEERWYIDEQCDYVIKCDKNWLKELINEGKILLASRISEERTIINIEYIPGLLSWYNSNYLKLDITCQVQQEDPIDLNLIETIKEQKYLKWQKGEWLVRDHNVLKVYTTEEFEKTFLPEFYKNRIKI